MRNILLNCNLDYYSDYNNNTTLIITNENKSASDNPPFVLSGIPLSGRPGYIQVCVVLLGLAPLGTAFSLQYRDLQAINHHNHLLPTGYHFCSVARRLRLIIANSSACSEGGVSSLSSNPHTSLT